MSSSDNTWTAATPDNGRVVFENVPIGEYEVRLQHPDYYNQIHTETLDRDGRAPIYGMTETIDDPNNVGGTQRRYTGVKPRHADRIRSDDPNITTTVETANGIETAINNASSGDIIWIDSTARINADSLFRVNIPNDVTLASNGAVLYLTENNSGMFKITNDAARVTGITFRGFHYDDMKDGTPYNLDEGTDPWNTASDTAITIMGDSQIDNCSFEGFCFAGINVGENVDNETEFNPHPTIRNCEFEYQLLTVGDNGGGLGYGIVCYSGSPSIEYCYFNNNRHSISGGGANMSRWTVKNSFFDTDGLQYGAEMRSTDEGAGRWVRYYNNESAYITNNSGNPRPAIMLRGAPTHLSQCRRSWFYNSTEPDPDNNNSPIQQYDTDGTNFENIDIVNNHYGADTDPPDDVGIQPDGKDYIDLIATTTVHDSTGSVIPTPRITVTADFNADGSTTEKTFTGSDGTVEALLPTGTHDITIDGIGTNTDGETVRSHGPTTVSVQMVDSDISVNNGDPVVIEETQEGAELKAPNGPEGSTSSNFGATVTNVEKTQTGNYTFEILLSNSGGGSGSTDVTLEEQ